jgi:hypothetical protein
VGYGSIRIEGHDIQMKDSTKWIQSVYNCESTLRKSRQNEKKKEKRKKPKTYWFFFGSDMRRRRENELYE